MNKELKPCPFCGGEAVINVIEPHEHVVVNLPPYPGGAFIECTGCTCAMSGQSEEEVIEAWNTRKPMDKVVEQLEDEISRYDKKYHKIVMQYHNIAANATLQGNIHGFQKAIKIVKGGVK